MRKFVWRCNLETYKAYIFVNVDPTLLWDVAESANAIEGVKMAHAVTGQFDVIAYVEFSTMDALREILGKFQSLKGVQRTQTAVALPPKLE